MSKRKVLVTGGAGFIGSHLCDELLVHGYEVRALDTLARRTHTTTERPAYLDPEVELVIGDVRDGAVVERALEGVHVVFHFAAAVGAGESLFEVERCTSVNNVGTAVLMDRLVRAPVEKLVLASSMNVYGEGLYHDPRGAAVDVKRRTPEQLRRGEWEPRVNGELLTPVPTPETKSVSIGSVYARSKFDQERMCLRFGRAFGIPSIALRFFNVFGTRQGLANPYTGDLAQFAARLLDNRRPLVAEDGEQRRDFVHVSDVARACRLALDVTSSPGTVLNVGTGRPIALAEMAQRMANVVGKPHLTPEITEKYRPDEVRHCFADVRRAEKSLGHWSSVDVDTQLEELVEWVASQTTNEKMGKKIVQLGMTP